MSSEKLFESFDDEEYWNPNEVTTKVEFSKPEIEKENRYTYTFYSISQIPANFNIISGAECENYRKSN